MTGDLKSSNFKRRVGNKKYIHQNGYFEPRHLGKLFLFSYDAKLKFKLPYWDKLPLILLFHQDNTGFMGLNLHYLPPKLRAVLLDAIVDNEIKNRRFDDKNERATPFTYDIMRRAAGNRFYNPCVKRYLFRNSGHHEGQGVTSSFLQIPGEDWDKVILLPWQRFDSKTGGVSDGQVWSDSIKPVS